MNLFKKLVWLLKVHPHDVGVTRSSVLEIMALFDRLSRTRGRRFAVSYIKGIRLIVTRFITRHPMSKYPHIRISNGLPSRLPKEMVNALRTERVESFQWILTILTFTRCFTLPVIGDYAPITDEWLGTIPQDLKKTILMYKPPFKITDSDWEQAHWTTKAGPTGPAMAEALNNRVFIPDELRDDLFLLGGDLFKKYYTMMSEAFPHGDEQAPNSDSTIRRIHLLEDKEGKTRIIAILDWWSQTVLRKYHDILIRILEKTPGDFTYQGDFLKHLESGDGPYFSFDLSSATDRFPVEVQRMVIENLFGFRKSEAWVRAMTKWPFKRPDGGPILWRTGQPIGAYSSWAAFALTHHIVLITACKDEPNARYAVLGDDVVIRGHNAAMNYKRIIEALGVPLSETKTHVSRDTFEFAKRWFRNGVEFSPFPLNSLNESMTRFVDLAQTFRTAELHGWPCVFTTPGLIADYLRKVIGMKPDHSQYVGRKTVKFMKYLDLTQCTLWDICTHKSTVLESFLDSRACERFSNLSLIEKVHSVRDVYLRISEAISKRVLDQLEESIHRFFREGKALVSTSKTELAPPVGLSCGAVAKRLRTLLSDFYSKSRLPEIADCSLSPGEEAIALGKLLRAVPLSNVPVGNDGRVRTSVLMLRVKAEIMVLMEATFAEWGADKLPQSNLSIGPDALQAFNARMFKEMIRAINSTNESDLPKLQ